MFVPICMNFISIILPKNNSDADLVVFLRILVYFIATDGGGGGGGGGDGRGERRQSDFILKRRKQFF